MMYLLTWTTMMNNHHEVEARMMIDDRKTAMGIYLDLRFDDNVIYGSMYELDENDKVIRDWGFSKEE